MKIPKLLLFLYCIIARGQHESLSSLHFPVNKELLLALVNAQRNQGCLCGDTYYPAVPSLKWSDKLTTIAQKHSEEMSVRKQLTHYSKNGADPGKRLSKAGYH